MFEGSLPIGFARLKKAIEPNERPVWLNGRKEEVRPGKPSEDRVESIFL